MHSQTKFQQNLTICNPVIDERTTFGSFFREGNFVRASSRGCADRTVPNLVDSEVYQKPLLTSFFCISDMLLPFETRPP